MEHWVFIVATKPEWSELKKKIPFVQDGAYTRFAVYHADWISGVPRKLTVIQTGVGPKRVKECVDQVFKDFRDVDLVIHFGLSGALVETLDIGDVIIPTQLRAHGELPLPIPGGALKRLHQAQLSEEIEAREVFLWSSEIVLSTPYDKRKVGKANQTSAVDMETYWAAQYFIKSDIQYVSLRCIFDPLEWDLSEIEESQMLSAQGEVKVAGLVKDLVKNPKLVFKLPRFQKASALGLKKIHQIIFRLLSSK